MPNSPSAPPTASPWSTRRAALPWWVIAIVIACVLLLTAGGLIALVRPAMLVAPGQAINGAARVYAGYVVSRNLAIATVLFGALLVRARRALSIVMVLTAVVQFLDAGIDGIEGRWALVPGVLLLGVLLVLGAARAARRSGDGPGSWRDLRDSLCNAT